MVSYNCRQRSVFEWLVENGADPDYRGNKDYSARNMFYSNYKYNQVIYSVVSVYLFWTYKQYYYYRSLKSIIPVRRQQ